MAGDFSWTSAGKQWPVENGQFRFPGWVRNGNGEEAGIFVIHVAEFDAVARSKGRQTQALPVKEILGCSQGDPWVSGRKSRVSHHVTLHGFHECDTRILAATAAIGPLLIIGLRLLVRCRAARRPPGRPLR